MAEETKKATAKASTRSADVQEGDPEAEPGTPEHLGSDHPYAGGEYYPEGGLEPK